MLVLLDRKRLFSLINDLPTVFEVVTERKPVKDKPSVDSGSKSRGSTKVRSIKLYFIISWFSSCMEFLILELGSIILCLSEVLSVEMIMKIRKSLLECPV